jgi:hypothetical protein
VEGDVVVPKVIVVVINGKVVDWVTGGTGSGASKEPIKELGSSVVEDLEFVVSADNIISLVSGQVVPKGEARAQVAEDEMVIGTEVSMCFVTEIY